MFNYPWACNKIKLSQAVEQIKKSQKLDPSVELNEGAIKKAYILRGGQVIEQVIENTEVVETVQKSEEPVVPVANVRRGRKVKA